MSLLSFETVLKVILKVIDVLEVAIQAIIGRKDSPDIDDVS